MALRKRSTGASSAEASNKRIVRKRKPSSEGAAEQLKEVTLVLGEVAARVKAMEKELTQNAWLRKPGLGGWSAIECIEHLNLTAERLLPRLEAGLQQAEPRNERTKAKGLRLDFVGWMLYKSLGSSGKLLRSKTAQSFVPNQEIQISTTLDRFYAQQRRLTDIAAKGESLRIDRVKITSPFNDRVKYNLYSALHIAAVHEHRHLDQADRAAKADASHELI